MWLWPKTSRSVSGCARAARASRPVRPPVSCTTATRTPASVCRATSGSRSRSSGPSLLPQQASSRRERSSSRSSSAADTQSPACTTTSAASTSAHTCAGRSLARVGRWVSASSSRRTPQSPSPVRAGLELSGRGDLEGPPSVRDRPFPSAGAAGHGLAGQDVAISRGLPSVRDRPFPSAGPPGTGSRGRTWRSRGACRAPVIAHFPSRAVAGCDRGPPSAVTPLPSAGPRAAGRGDLGACRASRDRPFPSAGPPAGARGRPWRSRGPAERP
jgi:hypothetical protein